MDMLSKYVANFAALDHDKAHHVAEAVAVKHHLPEVPDTPDGTALYEFCDDAGLDQADVVLSLSRDCTKVGVDSIETLIGKPIARVVPPAAKQVVVRGAAKRRGDVRKVVAMRANPKKPGTMAHARYALYRVGATVDELLAQGLLREDIRYDTKHGYVELE